MTRRHRPIRQQFRYAERHLDREADSWARKANRLERKLRRDPGNEDLRWQLEHAKNAWTSAEGDWSIARSRLREAQRRDVNDVLAREMQHRPAGNRRVPLLRVKGELEMTDRVR